MRKIEILSYGISLPKNTVTYNGQIRYIIDEPKGESHLDLLVRASKDALINGRIKINDVDCIVFAGAVGVQPIPCTAAVIHGKIAKGSGIPALDINTTCTGFITALDMMSYLIEAGKYKRVLIVAGDVPSQALNPRQRESYELFSDGAVAIILQKTDRDSGIIDAAQETWSEGLQSTEIRGGLSSYHPRNYSQATKEEFMFDMKGKEILSLSKDRIPPMVREFLKRNKMSVEHIDMVVPHQASMAMPLIMKKLGIKEGKYINLVQSHGNMVSASVPVTLCTGLSTGIIRKGDIILLIGTAAGLTTNLLLMKV